MYSKDKRMHVNAYIDGKKEAKIVIGGSKRRANKTFGRKINDDWNKNKKLFRKKMRTVENKRKINLQILIV